MNRTALRVARRQLAIFKAPGFTRRQLHATASWQASVSQVIGLLIGVPLGVIAGRLLRILFAAQIHAVPVPVVPVGWVIALAVGALVLANLVAAVPGRSATRPSTALVPRAD